jgi:hypothetical protein
MIFGNTNKPDIFFNKNSHGFVFCSGCEAKKADKIKPDEPIGGGLAVRCSRKQTKHGLVMTIFGQNGSTLNSCKKNTNRLSFYTNNVLKPTL